MKRIGLIGLIIVLAFLWIPTAPATSQSGDLFAMACQLSFAELGASVSPPVDTEFILRALTDARQNAVNLGVFPASDFDPIISRLESGTPPEEVCSDISNLRMKFQRISMSLCSCRSSNDIGVIRSGDDGDVWRAVPWIHPSWGNPVDDPLAKWTWATPEVNDPASGEVQTYERNFYIDRTPTSGKLTITCDNGYQVFLNGIEVGIDGLDHADSPWDTPEKRHDLGSAWQSAETYDIADKLIQGTNTLEIICVNYAAPGVADNQLNPAGLLYKLEWS